VAEERGVSVESVVPAATDPARDVLNQSEPLVDVNLFTTDVALAEAVEREGTAGARTALEAFGERMGRADALAWGEEANRNEPRLRTHDARGHRIDVVEYHPAYHALLEISIANGLHSLGWARPQAGAHVARAAMLLLAAQTEAGHLCAVGMTRGAIPVLRKQPDVWAVWEKRALANQYDGSDQPADGKAGVLLGMAMTERQGGSDVRTNITAATPLGRGGPGQPYAIAGHKWFCSAPMCDAFLVLAQTPGGVSCLLLPRWKPDGTRNGIHIQRLKDKLGNRSNASAEVEFDGSIAWLIGEEGRGVATIIDMVNSTRLDCALVTAGLMRAGVAHAVHHARQRRSFGRRLVEHPMMRNVLADLCLESEAATALTMRLARAFDHQYESETERLFLRLALPVAKYWICKRGPMLAAEAIECLGGNGYIEESVLPRIYREAPLNSLWEGCGNIVCLDVLRAMHDKPAAIDVVFDEMSGAAVTDRRLGAHLTALRAEMSDTETVEGRARRLVERLALALQASLLVAHGDQAVADAFCASRLGAPAGLAFGTLPDVNNLDAILTRALS
jgi:putative acyl-CoA dehydrogenase